MAMQTRADKIWTFLIKQLPKHPQDIIAKASSAFDRTDLLVKLSQLGGEAFISRSQAKRVLRNLDRFNQVTLDFTDVRMVGQGFIDQVFRVYVTEHPNITFDYINANTDVDFMIKRCLATQ